MLSKILEGLKENSQDAISMYLQGMSLLHSSGILEYLKEKARPVVRFDQPTDSVALQAARSAGYFECLEDLYNFRDYLTDSPRTNTVDMDFGATLLALEKGDLTEKDVNELRSRK